MKSIEYIYQDTEIHFLVYSNDKNVMVNATEMAKVYGKNTKLFLKSDHAKAFIETLKLGPNGPSLGEKLDEENIISFRGRNGIFFHRLLALKFAAWLDPSFELWVYARIEEVIFGNYKRHWDAHSRQEMARVEMDKMKLKLLSAPTPEAAEAYFRAEEEMKKAKNEKGWAIRNQLSLWDTLRDKE